MYARIRIQLVALASVLLIVAKLSAASAQEKYLTTNQKQIVDTVSTIFTAARADDVAKLALIPFRPLQHMLTLEDQIAVLTNARRHLTTGGILGFDVFFPDFSSFDQLDGVEQPEREWIDDEGRTVRRFFLRHRVDKVNQVIYASFIFRTYRGTDLVAEEISPLNMSYYTYPHLRLLLKLSQF